MRNFKVGVRHGAADAATLAAAGLVVDQTTYGGRGGQQEPLRHYAIVRAEDEAEAMAKVAEGLGWKGWAAADLIARPSQAAEQP